MAQTACSCTATSPESRHASTRVASVSRQLPDSHAITRLCLVVRHLAGALMDRHADERLPHALLAPPVGHVRGTSLGIRLDHQGAHGLV